MPEIYTIGYGNHKLEDFIGLLKHFKIELVVDVRRFPTSKWPEFVKETLEKSLLSSGIGYVHLRELGGYRRGYEIYMRTPEFRDGLEKLEELARDRSTAVMCVESHPSGCHRRFIARELQRKGWKVIHIGGKGKIL